VVDWTADIVQGIATGAGLFWRALWALILGYAFSAIIQVFVSRSDTAKYLGRPGPKEIGLSMLLGPISSACSFAALSATRALLTKGAHLIPALAFLFATTNLSPEVGGLAWIFLGWQFMLALYVGAFLLVAAMTIIVRLTYPVRLVEEAKRRATRPETGMGKMSMDPAEGLPASWKAKAQSREAWERVGLKFVDEWRMIWKDLAIGFIVAGLVAELVPDAVFKAIFPTAGPPWLLVPVHASLGPVLAVLTFIGSMGNGPLAAVLWQNGVLFAGIMVFLYSDFIVPPALRINAQYYGWNFALYVAAVFAVAAVIAGIAVHALFSAAGLIPEPKEGQVEKLAQFGVDYALFLNVGTLVLAGSLLWLAKNGSSRLGRKEGESRAVRERQGTRD